MGKAVSLCHLVATMYFTLAIFEKDILKDNSNWVSLMELEEKSAF